jgi:hypothetical protein
MTTTTTTSKVSETSRICWPHAIQVLNFMGNPFTVALIGFAQYHTQNRRARDSALDNLGVATRRLRVEVKIFVKGSPTVRILIARDGDSFEVITIVGHLRVMFNFIEVLGRNGKIILNKDALWSKTCQLVVLQTVRGHFCAYNTRPIASVVADHALAARFLEEFFRSAS